jgi:hypothetical protein
MALIPSGDRTSGSSADELARGSALRRATPRRSEGPRLCDRTGVGAGSSFWPRHPFSSMLAASSIRSVRLAPLPALQSGPVRSVIRRSDGPGPRAPRSGPDRTGRSDSGLIASGGEPGRSAAETVGWQRRPRTVRCPAVPLHDCNSWVFKQRGGKTLSRPYAGGSHRRRELARRNRRAPPDPARPAIIEGVSGREAHAAEGRSVPSR